MKKIKLISMLVLLSGSFACSNNPSIDEQNNPVSEDNINHNVDKDVNKQNADYRESYSFSSEVDALTENLKEVLSVLNRRTEKGLLTLLITGPKIEAKTEQKILSDIKNKLLIDVVLQTAEQQQDFYQVALAVHLSANTCRFEQTNIALSASACLLKRNQYLQLVNSHTWQQGLQYINNDSALATGAVQRLYKNRIKMADKQPVTGD